METSNIYESSDYNIYSVIVPEHPDLTLEKITLYYGGGFDGRYNKIEWVTYGKVKTPDIFNFAVSKKYTFQHDSDTMDDYVFRVSACYTNTVRSRTEVIELKDITMLKNSLK